MYLPIYQFLCQNDKPLPTKRVSNKVCGACNVWIRSKIDQLRIFRINGRRKDSVYFSSGNFSASQISEIPVDNFRNHFSAKSLSIIFERVKSFLVTIAKMLSPDSEHTPSAATTTTTKRAITGSQKFTSYLALHDWHITEGYHHLHSPVSFFKISRLGRVVVWSTTGNWAHELVLVYKLIGKLQHWKICAVCGRYDGGHRIRTQSILFRLQPVYLFTIGCWLKECIFKHKKSNNGIEFTIYYHTKCWMQ